MRWLAYRNLEIMMTRGEKKGIGETGRAFLPQQLKNFGSHNVPVGSCLFMIISPKGSTLASSSIMDNLYDLINAFLNYACSPNFKHTNKGLFHNDVAPKNT